MQTEVIELSLADEQGRRLPDPINPTVHHFEAYLPFSEAAKLRSGNANVRPRIDGRSRQAATSIGVTPAAPPSA